MTEVKFSNAAEADLVEIDEFSLAQFGEEVGESYMQGFTNAFALLARHPKAGGAKPKLGKGIRCYMCRRHRIFYRIDGAVVLIVRVVHHSRDAKRTLKGAAG